MQHRSSSDLSVDELRAFHRIATAADDLLEECVRDRLSLRATLARFLPAFESWLGAKGVLLATQDESLEQDNYTWGARLDLRASATRTGEGAEVLASGDTLLWQTLDLAGVEVGRIEVLLDGDRTSDVAVLRLMLDAACEELDAVLATIHTASHKQRLILEVTTQLQNPVFEAGVDGAVGILHREVGVPQFAFLFRDATEQRTFHYRVYKDGVLIHDDEKQPHPGLARAIADGHALLEPDRNTLQRALAFNSGVEQVLISGITKSERLGKVVYAGGLHGFSTYALDVVEVLCNSIGQRLVDFNRERRHLAKFFEARVITELLRDPAYADRFLSAREQTVAVLYADINSFTKICEQVLVQPSAISRFVDRWSAGAVQLLWDHGGVFDKMVGDCIIGIFGPPFFRDSVEGRAHRAADAAAAIAKFTTELEREAPYDLVPKSGAVAGLGVAIGLNLCPMSVGLFGPNQEFTGFSSGMNATARLQSLAGFRETLGMEAFCEALQRAGADHVAYGDVMESAVKNVKHPIRYRRLTFK